MSRILRRPMFRGGSTNMNGIMSGIQDRKNYAQGPENPRVDSGRFKELVEELRPVIQESFTGYQKPTGFDDPVYQLAIQTGLDLMSRADSGSLLRNIGAAGARQTPAFFKNLADERAQKRKYEQGIESAAVGLAGDILGREITASGKTPPADKLREATTGKYLDLGLPANVASRAANFELDNSDALRSKVGGSRYGGVIEFDLSKTDEVKANINLLKKYDGQIVYDPFEGNYKRIQIVNGQPFFEEFNSIDSIVFTEPKEAAQTTGKSYSEKLADVEEEIGIKAEDVATKRFP
tara:strand:+ start:198 stop:1076 length:879 start_codon:yes stop_codon:yes gene_type:complete